MWLFKVPYDKVNIRLNRLLECSKDSKDAIFEKLKAAFLFSLNYVLCYCKGLRCKNCSSAYHYSLLLRVHNDSICSGDLPAFTLLHLNAPCQFGALLLQWDCTLNSNFLIQILRDSCKTHASCMATYQIYFHIWVWQKLELKQCDFMFFFPSLHCCKNIQTRKIWKIGTGLHLAPVCTYSRLRPCTKQL